MEGKMKQYKFEMVNVEAALELIGGYEQIYKKLVQSFLENQNRLVEDVEAYLRTNQAEARRLVHSCKGIATNLGAFQLYEVTKELEVAIVNNDQPSIQAYFELFRTIFPKVYMELSSIEWD